MSIQTKRDQLRKLIAELEAGQAKAELTQNEGEALDAKAQEAEALQKEIDSFDAREAKLAAMRGTAGREPAPEAKRELPNPGQPQPNERKHDPVDGYMTLGAYVEAQKGLDRYFDTFGSGGAPQGVNFKLAEITRTGILRDRRGSDVFVPLRKSEIQELYEAKAVPSLGAGVIEPQRIADVPRVNEFDRLRLRDVLDVSSTQSNAVEYARVNGFTRAAAATAEQGTKPEGALTMDLVTEAVRTIAAWYPVTNQQLADYGQLRSIIDNHLVYDVEKEIENLIMYGDGTGQEFTGFVPETGVLAARTGVTTEDTNLDKIRGMITDVYSAGYEANGVVLHPRDWESVVLTKGTDAHFVWALAPDSQQPRIWGVPVIQTNSAEDTNGDTTEARNIIVGDFARGATYWDRMQTTVMVGWQGTQFVQNMRTILAEARGVLGITRPAAFRKLETQAAVV
jgi:HK97 family phage major capsid protein